MLNVHNMSVFHFHKLHLHSFMHSFIAFFHLENVGTTLESFYFNYIITFYKVVYIFISHKFSGLLIDDTSLRNMTLFLKNITTLIHPKNFYHTTPPVLLNISPLGLPLKSSQCF